MFSEIYEKLKELFNADTYAMSKKKAGSGVKKFTKKISQNKVSDDFIKRKNQSLNDSQGVDDFSGSGYKAPGNVDHEKTNSNMSQRNF